MPRTLDEIVERARRLLELDYAELAGALGVHDTTLYRWRSGERDLSDRARGRLAGLVHLLDRVESAHPDPERRRAWLHEPLAGFGGQTPRQLLRAGSTQLLAGYLLGRDAPGEERPGGVPQLGRMGRRLLETVRSAPFPMILSAEDGEILEVSRALVEITGYARDELRTMDDWTRRAYGPEHRAADRRIARELAGEVEGPGGEWEVRTRDGEGRIWDFTNVLLDPLPDGRSLLLSTAADVTERKRTLRRSRLLADAGAVLTGPTDPEEALQELARLMTETVADFAIVYRVDEGRLRRVARIHRDPDAQAVLEEFERRFPLSRDHAMARRLFESGEPLLLDRVRPEAFATETEHARLLESMAPATGIGVPMSGAEGPLGIFAVATVEGGRPPLEEEDRTTVAEIARRAAVALENRRLQRLEREARRAAERRARRIAALQRASATLTRALTPGEVRRTLVDDAAASLGGSGGALILAGDDPEWLEVIHSAGAGDRGIRERWSRVPADPELPGPGSEVFRSGDPIFISTPAEWEARYPHLEGLLEEFGGRSVAYLPVEVGEERSGVLVLRFSEERPFGGEERAVLLALAQLAGHGLERARLFQAEREAREEAEVASVAKSQFLSVVSHELRTPLNAILGRASLMDEEIPGELNRAQKEHVHRIREGAEHLTSIIDQILSYSQAGRGREEPEYATVEVTTLAREVGELLKPRAAEAGLDLKLRLPDDALEVETDPGKLRHVLLNLLENAIKFTEEGAVEVAVQRTDGIVELSVADTGPGIPAEARERIFEPFVQLDQTRTRIRGGTGMGLAVVARHVERLGGSVEVGDGPEDGSLFRVRHPIRRDG